MEKTFLIQRSFLTLVTNLCLESENNKILQAKTEVYYLFNCDHSTLPHFALRVLKSVRQCFATLRPIFLCISSTSFHNLLGH